MDAEWSAIAAVGGIISLLPYVGVAIADWLTGWRHRY